MCPNSEMEDFMSETPFYYMYINKPLRTYPEGDGRQIFPVKQQARWNIFYVEITVSCFKMSQSLWKLMRFVI